MVCIDLGNQTTCFNLVIFLEVHNIQTNNYICRAKKPPAILMGIVMMFLISVRKCILL